MSLIKLAIISTSYATLLLSCNEVGTNQLTTAKEEVAKVERDFAEMTSKKGIAEAFWFFADSNAVIKRGKDSLIKGKDAIRNFYSAEFYKSASVKWSPDFIDASASSDLAYTYGKYLWQSKDSTGKTNELTGVFHTVWKRQSDGSWKYVWD